MKKSLVSILLAISFVCHAKQSEVGDDWQFVGHSIALNKCSQLNEELPTKNHANRKAAYKLWLGGFFTALNIISETNVLQETNLEDFYIKLEESCKKYPTVYVGTLVSELSTPYLERAIRNAGPNK